MVSLQPRQWSHEHNACHYMSVAKMPSAVVTSRRKGGVTLVASSRPIREPVSEIAVDGIENAVVEDAIAEEAV